MTTPQNDLVAIGVLAQQLQQSVRTIEAVCVALNLPPAMRVNYVPFFDAEQVNRIAARLAEAANGNPLPTANIPGLLGRQCVLPPLGRM